MPDTVEGLKFLTGEPLRILIIDDDPLFHGLIGSNAEMLGCTWQSACSLEEAMQAIQEAEDNHCPFSLVTIDLKFQVGSGEIMPIGKMILQRIKSRYPNLACIVISGLNVSAHEVLDLRDMYALDYYISKDRFDSDTFDRGIKRAMERVNPLGNIQRRREVLHETLEKYRDISSICARNLALMEEKKAQKGIDVSVDIENQIKLYQGQLEQARDKVKELEKELQQVETQ